MHPFRRASFGREVHTRVVDPTEPPCFDVWDVLELPYRPRPKESTHAAQLPARSSRCWYDLSAPVMASRPDVEVYHASPDADRASPTRNGACRTRHIVGAAESLLFETLLRWCRDRHLVNAGGRQRTDSTPILAAVWALIHIEVVGDTWRHALNRLAVVVPEGEVFNQGWSALRPGRAVCTFHAALSTADADHPAPEAISGPAGVPTTGSGRRVSGGLCSPCRH